jgi:hypothetical protein
MHELNWTPGNDGKGLVAPDGAVHTWNVDRLDGVPNHRHYMIDHGMGDPYPNQDLRNQVSAFWIGKQGETEIIHDWGDPTGETYDMIERIDPRLRRTQDPYFNFSYSRTADMQNQKRALTPEDEELINMLTGTVPPPIKRTPEQEARQQERENDPLGHEMRGDWDQPSETDHPDVRWVPSHELAKFMEYDRKPGGKDAWTSQERWNALGEHIKQNGIKRPVWIDFNPDTSMAHLSEGNHRVQLALDHGLDAVPVRVIRSTRKSPTQVRVNATPQPEWEDRYDPSGYHWPQYMTAEHIGLPTVPAPDLTGGWQL